MRRTAASLPPEVLAGLVSFVAYVALAARVRPDPPRAITTRAAAGDNHAPRSHCAHGHPFAGDNLRITPSGKKKCRECDRQRARRSYARQRAKGAIDG